MNDGIHDAKYWVDRLELEEHPEGGFFKETYRAHESISQSALPPRFNGDRLGQRSSRLSLQYRVIYSVKAKEIRVYVLGVQEQS